MNTQKRLNYNLTGSFHTLEIKSPAIAPSDDEQVNRSITTRLNRDKTVATSKINPNKYQGDIFSYNEFCTVFNEILNKSGIGKYRITRADMRFDNYDGNHYQEYAKLNKYLLSALAVTYSVKNVYQTIHLITGNQLSIAVKNDYFEAESYDRDHKNLVTGNTEEPAKARLEERSVARQWRKINSGIGYFSSDDNMARLEFEFSNGWEERWDKAKQNLEVVQDRFNDELVKKYQVGKNARPVQFRTLTDFLIQHQNSIFTSMQMENLLNRLGVTNARERAKYHKRKYGIEYFSKADVSYAIDEIKRATKEYFGEKREREVPFSGEKFSPKSGKKSL